MDPGGGRSVWGGSATDRGNYNRREEAQQGVGNVAGREGIRARQWIQLGMVVARSGSIGWLSTAVDLDGESD